MEGAKLPVRRGGGGGGLGNRLPLAGVPDCTPSRRGGGGTDRLGVESELLTAPDGRGGGGGALAAGRATASLAASVASVPAVGLTDRRFVGARGGFGMDFFGDELTFFLFGCCMMLAEQESRNSNTGLWPRGQVSQAGGSVICCERWVDSWVENGRRNPPPRIGPAASSARARSSGDTLDETAARNFLPPQGDTIFTRAGRARGRTER